MVFLVLLGVVFLMLIIGSVMSGFAFNAIGALADLAMLIGLIFIIMAIFGSCAA